MKCAIAAFSPCGIALMQTIAPLLEAKAFVPEKYASEHVYPMEGGLKTWVAQAFSAYDALIFVGAVGIAVRAIAPHIKDKTKDPAVIVMDELGAHAIPILSGHIGGANELAQKIAEITGAYPVITTATDIHRIPAIDTWATHNGMAIENPTAIKHISAAALNSDPVGVAITERNITPPFPITLFLRPRTLVVGIGCKRGVEIIHLEACLAAFFQQCGVSPLSVRAFASIDRKADEAAIVSVSQKYHLPFITYSAEELGSVPGVFSASEWVQQTVGVDNVCERTAVKCAGGRLLQGKTIYDGVTLALAGEDDNI